MARHREQKKTDTAGSTDRDPAGWTMTSEKTKGKPRRRFNHSKTPHSSSSSSSSAPLSSFSSLLSSCRAGFLHSPRSTLALLLFLLAIVSALVFHNRVRILSFAGVGEASGLDDLETDNATIELEDDVLGGWRPAPEQVLAQYGSDICDVERVSVNELPPERFESEFRFQKPVLVTFPDGASGWTDPAKWSRRALVKAYSKWTIHSGQSLDIVRKGGNAKHQSSFLEFVDNLLDDQTEQTGPQHYAFDRRFYWNSDLPQTLRLPEYFQVNTSRDESIFFLGSSTTGVVFHKHSDTWNGVVYGRKRWFLYPSTRTPPGGVHHGYSLLDWVSQVYPNLTESQRPAECVQQAGEILYLPEGMYHATLNLGDTVAVAIQRKQATLRTEQLSYEARDLSNLIQEKDSPDPHSFYNSRLLEIYEELHRLLPESAEVMVKIGQTLLDMERYTEALPWHMKAIKTEPYFVLAYLHMGKTLSKLRQYERAEITFLRAMELSPQLWDNYKEYGEFLLRQGRHAHALPIFQKGTELVPDLLPFWFYLRQCQLAVGDTEGARHSQGVMAELKATAED